MTRTTTATTIAAIEYQAALERSESSDKTGTPKKMSVAQLCLELFVSQRYNPTFAEFRSFEGNVPPNRRALQ